MYVIQDGMDGDLDKILSFSLQVLHGMELSTLEQSRQKHLCRLLTIDFVEALEKIIHHPPGCPDETTDAATPTSATPGAKDDTGILRSHRSGAAHTGTSQQSGSDDGARGSNDRRGDVFVATTSRKRSRDENVRLGCPFRAKNQLRFNVRDHQGCALVSFSSMSDLRQHVVRKHHRYDPEDGIDNDTVPRILNRGRDSSQPQGESSVEVQYAELWRLIFPECEEVPDHSKCHATEPQPEHACEESGADTRPSKTTMSLWRTETWSPNTRVFCLSLSTTCGFDSAQQTTSCCRSFQPHSSITSTWLSEIAAQRPRT